MTTLKQADIAREFGISQMTVSRVLKALRRNGQPLTETDAIMALTCVELQALDKLNGAASIRLIAEISDEIRYLAANRSRRCWVVFVENEHGSFRLTAHTAHHLESLLDAFPLSLVLPLHEVVGRALERLDGLQAKKSKEAV